MRKTIRDFNNVTVADPNDLILIDHYGVTSNISLSTVQGSIVDIVTPAFTTITDKISSSLTKTISSLSYVIEDINVILRPKIVDLIDDLNLNETNDSNFVIATRNNLAYLSAKVDTVQPTITSFDLSVRSLSSVVFDLSSRVNQLSGAVDVALSAYNLSASLSTIMFELTSNINSLSSSYLHLSAQFDFLSGAEMFFLSSYNLSHTLCSLVFDLSSNVNTLSAEYTYFTTLCSIVYNLSSNVDTLSSNVNILSADYTYFTTLCTTVFNLSSSFYNLSSNVNSLSADYTYFTTLCSIVYNLSSNVNTLSSDYTYFTTLCSIVYNLSSNVNSLSSIGQYYLSSINLLNSLSSSISSSFESLYLHISSLSSLAIYLSSFGDSTITLSGNYVIGNSALNLLPDVNNPASNIPINNLGSITFPSRVMFGNQFLTAGTQIQPSIINPQKTIQNLNSGYYELPDGTEGQIIYFIPKTILSGDFSCQIFVHNARYWGMANRIKTCFEGPFYWVPWNLVLDRLDPYDEIQPTVATAIFSDGAWNFSTGGTSWGFSQQSV